MQLFNDAKAVKTAKVLNADVEDDWTYKVRKADNGLSAIDIYDEENVKIGEF